MRWCHTGLELLWPGKSLALCVCVFFVWFFFCFFCSIYLFLFCFSVNWYWERKCHHTGWVDIWAFLPFTAYIGETTWVLTWTGLAWGIKTRRQSLAGQAEGWTRTAPPWETNHGSQFRDLLSKGCASSQRYVGGRRREGNLVIKTNDTVDVEAISITCRF